MSHKLNNDMSVLRRQLNILLEPRFAQSPEEMIDEELVKCFLRRSEMNSILDRSNLVAFEICLNLRSACQGGAV